MRIVTGFLLISFVIVISLSCAEDNSLPAYESPSPSQPISPSSSSHPKIASWLSKKDQIIESQKPFDLITAAFFMPDEAKRIRETNPDTLLLAGLTTNWVWENENWKKTLTTFASHGRDKTLEIQDNMYLTKPNGEKCPFGWTSENWGHEEIYAMDPRNPEWVDLVVAYYKMVLEQPQHDGIIIDMVTETSLCQQAISDEEWITATKEVFRRIAEVNQNDKLVLFNAGKDFSEIDTYAEFFDGYFMENFMGEILKSSYEEGLQAANSNYIVIYAMDTDNTGIQDMNEMRLGLTLSLLNDNTYFAYDFGPRDHGQAWWFPEYEIELGNPLGTYYEKDDAYWRAFENGMVISSPNSSVQFSFDTVHTDVTTGNRSRTFTVDPGDGRVYLKAG